MGQEENEKETKKEKKDEEVSHGKGRHTDTLQSNALLPLSFD